MYDEERGIRYDPTVTSDVRVEMIRTYAVQFPEVRLFVETGTADGDTCKAVHEYFDEIHTIEIVPSVYEWTQKRIGRSYPKIRFYQGDSTLILPGILGQLNRSCFFWLDGHYCGSLEARGVKDTPVAEELEIIFATGLRHVVLIDDARLFGRDPAYPTVEWVRDLATSQDIEYAFSYEDDIMRILPVGGA